MEENKNIEVEEKEEKREMSKSKRAILIALCSILLVFAAFLVYRGLKDIFRPESDASAAEIESIDISLTQELDYEFLNFACCYTTDSLGYPCPIYNIYGALIRFNSYYESMTPSLKLAVVPYSIGWSELSFADSSCYFLFDYGGSDFICSDGDWYYYRYIFKVCDFNKSGGSADLDLMDEEFVAVGLYTEDYLSYGFSNGIEIVDLYCQDYTTLCSDFKNQGYSNGIQVGYENGFSDGETQGYEDGQTAGYNAGFAAGTVAGGDAKYDEGYAAGYDEGYAEGTFDMDFYCEQNYLQGFHEGQIEGQGNVETLLGTVLEAPVNFVKSVFNFEIMGINIASLVLFGLTIAIAIFVIRKLKG